MKKRIAENTMPLDFDDDMQVEWNTRHFLSEWTQDYRPIQRARLQCEETRQRL
jgi:hypothetical protein